MQRIKKDDEIIVVAGKDKGRTGKVMSLTANDRVLVEGINLAKKHQKANPNAGQAGGIIEKEMSLHCFNGGEISKNHSCSSYVHDTCCASLYATLDVCHPRCVVPNLRPYDVVIRTYTTGSTSAILEKNNVINF